ncbi:MAG: metallophosphoesterase family protein [Prevotella sp.]|nr:metallophosphoesterase family protein [Prevotella sp.]MDD7709188.1 metallophosphoesterase family protein [Prevotella sp.]MDY4150618.1 metallophosphoesterase family protein [Prevotella sp.]
MFRKLILGLTMLMCIGQAFAQNTLRFKKGLFKIVQITDLHYKLGVKASEQGLACVREMVETEKPDLVVVTGDIIYSAPADSTLSVVLKTFAQLGVPFCMTFGNHDYDFKTPAVALYNQMQKTPNCVMPVLQGKNTDYSLSILSSNGKRTAAVLYCIDTHNKPAIGGIGGYQWISHNQITWYRQRSMVYKQKNGGRPVPSLAFLHIPLPEFNYATDNTQCPMYGSRLEKAYSPSLNSGMFASIKEMGDIMGVFCGHDHDNDYAVSYFNVLLAHGRFSGGNTEYNHLKSGARVIVLKEGKREFDTWIREVGGNVLYRTTYPKSYVKDNWRKRK